MKITKSQLKRIIKEEINEMLGEVYAGAGHGSAPASFMTTDEIEYLMEKAGVQGLAHGVAIDLQYRLDRKNINQEEFVNLLNNMPHDVKDLPFPHDAIAWLLGEIG